MSLETEESIEQISSSRKVIVGASYLLSEKMLKLLVGLLVHALMARYLGPSQFGRVGYVINFATAFMPLTLFGLDDLGVKKILHKSKSAEEILAIILTIRFFSFLFVSLVSALGLAMTSPDGGLNFAIMTWGFCFIYNLIGVFFSLELPFLASVNNRPIFTARFSGYVAGSTLKLIAIYQKLGFLFILCTYLLEEIVSKLLLLNSLRREFSFSLTRLTAEHVAEYLKPSFWIVMGSFLLVLEHKIGFLALEKFSDQKSLGFFTAAYMLVDLWTFVPLAIISAILPSLFKLHLENPGKYVDKIKDLHGLFFVLEVGFVVSVWFISPLLIKALYGSDFYGAERFLRWQSLTVCVMFTQLLRMRWFLIEDQLRLWAMMISVEVILTTILVFGLKRNDISSIVLSIVVSFISTNLFFCLKFQLVRSSLNNLFLAPLYSVRAIRSLRS